ncbi:RNA polymerase factor sigma-54 [Sediminibacterium ginsengisoli]|uniref:RNA polymerase, sigma 54 subunit, RpoN/SigL n=1 Tax=Sediminibacterium ginsengisoli TaxID=413434 RepID=A0A1T4Q239_9BACT|nr:RNA polymerase factor sigma-54 [Sediminibacterium ginsengisoli]SJZ97288.1 RNA polymerase, sigma 54 subunit, RpoN/SigL [Sediminibacterium ginsengisoli]
MLHQSQLQKNTLKILPQQIQMLNMYHLNNIELELRIKDELDENPLLEMEQEDSEPVEFGKNDEPQDYQDWDEYGYDDRPDYRVEHESYIHSNNYNIPVRENEDFRSMLKMQLIDKKLSEQELAVAEYLLDSVTESGFLERDMQDICDDISFSHGHMVDMDQVEKIRLMLLSMEPLGVGCRNIREFLLLQLNGVVSKCPVTRKAIQLIDRHYDDLRKRCLDKIMDALELDEEELSIVLKHIGQLQLKPVNERYEATVAKETIIPDFVITVENEMVLVDLCRPRAGALTINTSLMEVAEKSDAGAARNKSTMQYMKSKLSSAMWFVQAVKQREENMLRIIKAIVKKQKEYFLHGDPSLLKPMILKNIADEVGLDISTISRVTCNKYVDTPFGLILLKNLFTEGIINREGESVSNKVIQITLEEIVRNEDKNNPYSDQQLVALLETRGIKIARRTVAKYRDILNIPVGDMRKIWAKAI